MKPHLPLRLLAALAAVWSVLSMPAHAADVVKNDTASALNDASSWTGGALPGSGDVAVWDATSNSGTQDDPLALGGDVAWAGIKLQSATDLNVFLGNPTASALPTLSLGATGIKFTSATAKKHQLTLGAHLELVADQSWGNSDGALWGIDNQVTVLGNLTGSGNLTSVTGTGIRLTVEGSAAEYTGNINFNEGNHLVFASGLTNGNITASSWGGQADLVVKNGSGFNYTHSLSLGGNGTPGVDGAGWSLLTLQAGELTLSGTNTLRNLKYRLGKDASLVIRGKTTLSYQTILERVDNNASGQATIQFVGTHDVETSGTISVGKGMTLDLREGVLQYKAWKNANQSVMISGILKVTDYVYGGGSGGLANIANYAQNRWLTGGTIEVYGDTQNSALGFTVGGGGGAFLMMKDGQTLTLSGDDNGTTINFAVGNELRIGGNGNIILSAGASQSAISGNGILTKVGGGTLTLDHKSSFRGTVNLREGKLVLGDAQALGTKEVFLRYDGGALDLNGYDLTNVILSFGDGKTTADLLNGENFAGIYNLASTGAWDLTQTQAFGKGYFMEADTTLTLQESIAASTDATDGRSYLKGTGGVMTLTGAGLNFTIDNFGATSGAINAASVAFDTLGDITISNNASASTLSEAGGGVTATGSITFANTGNVTMAGNSASNGSATTDGSAVETSTGLGGALKADGGVRFDTTGDLTFTGNRASLNGGAIYDGGASLDYDLHTGITLTGIGNAVFSDNQAGGTSAPDNGNGGAIYEGTGSLTIAGAGDISFTGNKALSGSGGGAFSWGEISISDTGVVVFDQNTATAAGGALYSEGDTVTISDVRANGGDALTFTNNSAGTVGGAIGTSTGGVEINSIVGNVVFSGNQATGTSADAVDSGNGGAIYAYDVVTISGVQGDVSFTGNAAASYGGAIYAYGVTLFADGGNIVFDGNTHRGGQALNAIDTQIDGSTFTFDAAEGREIRFYDPVTGGAELMATVAFNGAEDATGTILFSGAHVANHTSGDLDEALSKYSDIYANTTLGGGKLVLEQGVTYGHVSDDWSAENEDYRTSFVATGGAIDIDADSTLSATTIELGNTVLDALKGGRLAAQTVVFGNGSMKVGRQLTVNVQDSLTFDEGTVITFDMTGRSTATAQLDVTGTLNVNGACVIDLSNYGDLAEEDAYVLMTWAQGSDTLTENSFVLADSVDMTEHTYTLELDADGNRLVLHVGPKSIASDWIWNGSETVWKDDYAGWGSPDALTDGTPNGQDVWFTDAGVTAGDTATVTIEGAVLPSSVTVSGSKNYIFEAGMDGAIGGDATLTKEGSGTLTLRLANNYAGGTTLKGGTLVVEAAGALGSGILQVESNATLSMKADVANKASLQDGATLTINVDSASATYAGQVTGSGSLVKTGAGVLALSAGGTNVASANTFSGNVTVKEGTLRLDGVGGGTTGTCGVLGASNVSSDRTIAVIAGATLDMNGQKDQNYAVTIAGDGIDGQGALVNKGQAVGLGQITFPSITLSDDASLGGTGDFGMVATQYGVTTLDLAGHMLTKKGSNTITLINTLVKAGSIDVEEGTLAIGSGHGNSVAEGVSFHIGSDGRFNLNGTTLSVQALTGSGIVDLGAASGSLTVADAGVFDGSILGAGSLYWNGAGEQILGGGVGGTVNVHAAGGDLKLTAANTSTGTLTIDNERTTRIDGGSWVGSVAGEGTLELVKGSLGAPGAASQVADSVNVTVNASAGSKGAVNTIDVNGLAGSKLTSITLGAYSTLTGVTGDITVGGAGNTTSMSLTLTENNVGKGKEADALITQTGNLTIDDGAKVDLSIDAIIKLLTDHKVDGVTSYLTLTSGNLEGDYAHIVFSERLQAHGLLIAGTSGGSLLVQGQTEDIYDTGDFAESDRVIDSYNEPGIYKGIVIQENHSLTLSLDGAPGTDAVDGGALVRDLMGAQGSVLHVVNTGDNEDGMNNAVVRLQSGETLGSIDGEGGVTFVKDGADSLKIGGSLVGEVLQMREGSLVLDGDGSDIDSVELVGTNEGALPELTLNGSASVGTLSDDDGLGGVLTLGGKDAQLVLDLNSRLSQSSIGGMGSLELKNELALSGTAKIDGDIALHLAPTANGETGTLDLGSTTGNSIASLAGEGILKGSAGSELSIVTRDGAVSTFGGSLEGALSVTIAGKGTQAFRGTNVGGGTASIRVESGAGLQLAMNEDGTNSSLSLDSLYLANGSQTSFTLDTDAWASSTANNRAAVGNRPIVTAGSITIEEGAQITLKSLDKNGHLTAGTEYTLMTATTGTNGENIHLGADGTLAIDTDGAAFVLISEAWLKREGNNIVLVTKKRESNYYASLGTSHNAASGAQLLWDAVGSGLAAGGTLEQVNEAVYNDMTTDPGRASRTLAAAAGSTVASLGMAQKDALRDQMGWIRNRLTNMGVDQVLINEDLPYFHMWAQATGNHATLDRKGDESGYTLDTWGGTVGLDLDVSEHLTFGAAFTAAYGDLDATGAETATGDLDSYYVNLFGRAQVKRWTHKLILSVGINDAKLTRTVDYGAGSYKARGTTNGTGFGAMYEVAYDAWMNEDATAVLQPLLNLSIVSTTMDAYSESGGTAGDAGLNVGKQDMTVGTVALGVRLAGQLSENALGRSSFGEFRVNVAQDMGDDRSHANVGFIGAPGTQRIRGAKEGMTAIQIGAGLTVPVGEQSSIFFDVNADFRSHASSVNGSVGYRYDF